VEGAWSVWWSSKAKMSSIGMVASSPVSKGHLGIDLPCLVSKSESPKFAAPAQEAKDTSN